MNKAEEKLLLEVLSLPTAPFREDHVKSRAITFLQARHIPHFEDPIGNIVIGCDNATRYKRLLNSRSTEPVRLFIAHMDHPGYHGVRWLDNTRLLAKWHGGSPVKLLRGSNVWLGDASRELGRGKITKSILAKHGHSMDSLEISFPRQLFQNGNRPRATGLFGGFIFRSALWTQRRRIYTRAADDLAGVFCILATAAAWHRQPASKQTPFIGLLTRGEEVGFVGAVGHFELGWLTAARRPLCAISLEASRTLPGALIGHGPVLRQGDRRTVFNNDYLQVLSQVAQKHLAGKHQKRVMDGGACEGTASTAYGIATIGLSVPLGNYHNEGFEGGPDCRGFRGPAPECIHLDDVAGELLLCKKLLAPGLLWDRPWEGVRKQLRQRLRHYRSLL